jgi:hypothetical protein
MTGPCESRLTPCLACGRRHLISSLVPHPDRPHILLCPVRTRGVMRLAPFERAEADRLLRSAFGGDSS